MWKEKEEKSQFVLKTLKYEPENMYLKSQTGRITTRLIFCCFNTYSLVKSFLTATLGLVTECTNKTVKLHLFVMTQCV